MEDRNSKVTRDILSDITVHMKYAKYRKDLSRRETWSELVDRNKSMHLAKFPELKEDIDWAYQYVYDRKVLPSMRSLQFAGRPIELANARMYNCSYAPADHWKVFPEAMLLLLSGCGFGFSVQKRHIEKLPEIRKPSTKSTRRFLVGDSIEGWADAVKVLFKSYFFGGAKIRFDYSDIRPKGAALVTSGGKAPGPAPLRECLTKIENLLEIKQDGEKLSSVEVHDLLCHIAASVLSGGIRRSSEISFFDVDDEEMLNCKTGNWWEINPQRAMANNSAVMVRHKLDEETFRFVLDRTEASNAGEPGIMLTNDPDILGNPCVTADTMVLTSTGLKPVSELIGTKFKAVVNGVEYDTVSDGFFYTGDKQVYELKTSTGKKVKTTGNHEFLMADGSWLALDDIKVGDKLKQRSLDLEDVISITMLGIEPVYDVTVNEVHCFDGNGIILHNCNEISLRPNGVCNLTTINASDLETQEEYNKRSRAASIIGTLQASYTDFHYLRDEWKKTAEKEALLGVSMTGIASGNVLKLNMREAAKICVATNKEFAKKIGIRPAARVTTCKPEGTSSLVVGSASGIHAWHAPFYARRLRVNKNEAIYGYLKEYYPKLIEDEFFRPNETAVLTVPIKAPIGAIIRTETALELLERVKKVHEEWIRPGHVKGSNTHNVSVTVSVAPNEWEEVKTWMWENRECYSGISLLPKFESDHTYKQPPFSDITEEEFNNLAEGLEEIDLSVVVEYDDNTDLQGELACASGACIVT